MGTEGGVFPFLSENIFWGSILMAGKKETEILSRLSRREEFWCKLEEEQILS